MAGVRHGHHSAYKTNKQASKQRVIATKIKRKGYSAPNFDVERRLELSAIYSGWKEEGIYNILEKARPWIG